VKRWCGVLLATLTLLTSVSLTSAVTFAKPASASPIDCMDGNAYYSRFDGYYSSAGSPTGGTYEGASADLINNTAPICDTGTQDPNFNFNYVWVMIHQNNAAPGGSAHGYAQMGFYRGYAQPCGYFTNEYSQDGNDTYHRYIETRLCLDPYTINQYWVQFVPTDNYGNGGIRMNVDVTIMGITPFSPYNAWNPATYGPFFTEFNGETKYLGSDIPDTNYQRIEVQQEAGDAFTSTLPSLYDGCPWPNRYQKSTIANNFFAISTGGQSGYHYC